MNVANSATTLLSIEADIPQSLIDCSSYNVTKLQNKNSTQITHFKLQLLYSSSFHPHAIMQSQFLFIHQDHLNSLTLELVTRLCHLVFHLQKNYFKFVKLTEKYDIRNLWLLVLIGIFGQIIELVKLPHLNATHLLLFQLIGVHKTLSMCIKK